MASSRLKPVYVVSAPSGTGKTTLNRRLIKEFPQVEIAISLTTRKKRDGEHDGVHYHFIDRQTFESHMARGEMLEHAEVFGNLYGTPMSEVTRIRDAGHIPILEIDVQGWQAVSPKLPESIGVFIIPPNLETLWKRLEMRGTDSLETRWKRLQTAKLEIEAGRTYHYFVVNDHIEHAYEEIRRVIVEGKPGRIANSEGKLLCQHLLDEFDTSGWLKDLERKFGTRS